MGCRHMGLELSQGREEGPLSHRQAATVTELRPGPQALRATLGRADSSDSPANAQETVSPTDRRGRQVQEGAGS